MQPDELSSEAQRSTPRVAGEEEKVISTFEEAFRRIKEATGVTDIQVEMWKEAAVPAVRARVMYLVMYIVVRFFNSCVHL